MKRIYFIGIKGVGMAALAVIAKEAGFEVRGSDVAEKFITDEILARHTIPVDVGFDTTTIDSYVSNDSLVVVTAAHGGRDNPQIRAAESKGARILSYGQAVGVFQSGELFENRQIKGISVAGAHGKTTTAAMLATTLKYLNEDPSFLIGTSEVAALGDAGHYGTGEYFIVEADEYVADVKHDRTSKFLYQHPFAALVTNIDFDHPDVFENLNEVKESFKKFAEQISDILCYNGDDAVSLETLRDTPSTVRKITYGESVGNDYSVTNFRTTADGITFDVVHQKILLGAVTLSVLGRHNALNALSVIALVHTLGYEFSAISQALVHFTGSKRRLEIQGRTENGSLIIDDYGHHPREIAASLAAIREAYPGQKIVCIFQPHTLSRTKALVEEFSTAFESADEVLLLPIFASAREGLVEPQAQQELYKKIVVNGKTKVMEAAHVVEYCTKNFSNPDTILVTMGAGDVYKIASSLIASSV